MLYNLMKRKDIRFNFASKHVPVKNEILNGYKNIRNCLYFYKDEIDKIIYDE